MENLFLYNPVLSHLFRNFGGSWYFICCGNGEIRNVCHQSWSELRLYWVSGSFQKIWKFDDDLSFWTFLWLIPKRFLISYLIFLMAILFMQYNGLSILYWYKTDDIIYSVHLYFCLVRSTYFFLISFKYIQFIIYFFKKIVCLQKITE